MGRRAKYYHIILHENHKNSKNSNKLYTVESVQADICLFLQNISRFLNQSLNIMQNQQSLFSSRFPFI